MSLLRETVPQGQWTVLKQGGALPPHGIFVEFTVDCPGFPTFRGLAADLASMGPRHYHETVLVALQTDNSSWVGEANRRRVFWKREVLAWRETNQVVGAMTEFV